MAMGGFALGGARRCEDRPPAVEARAGGAARERSVAAAGVVRTEADAGLLDIGPTPLER